MAFNFSMDVGNFLGNLGGVASSIIGHNVGLSRSEKQQNAFNAEQAQINRDWQEKCQTLHFNVK